MRTGSATGLQIVFLLFTVTLLAVPVTAYVATLHGPLAAHSDDLGRFMPFLLGGLIVAAFPGLRRWAAELLAAPIPAGRRTEVAFVALGKLAVALAATGGAALYYWILDGPAILEHRMRAWPEAIHHLTRAFSPAGMLFFLAAATIGPVMEELIFRGFLYRAWERRWGALVSAVLVSTLFALYHPHFLASFAGSIVLICVLRRTGSLWAAIVVHGIYNALLWYPLAGQFLMPPEGSALGDLASWRVQLACLLFVIIALPAYIWLARRPYEPDPFAGRGA